MSGYTMTFDASHKVGRGGGHLKTFLRHVARDADERAGVTNPHANPNIDAARTAQNVTWVNDSEGGFRRALSSDDLAAYLDQRLATVAKPLRKDAVLLRPLILQLDPQWYTDHVPDWRSRGVGPEAARLHKAAVEWVCDEFGQPNVVGVALHADEVNPQLHVLVTPVTGDGRLSQKDFFKGPADLRRQHQALREHMAAAGYAVDFGTSARSREHLDSAEFQAKADRLREGTATLDRREAAILTREQAVARKGDETEAARLAYLDGVRAAKAAETALKAETEALRGARISTAAKATINEAAARRNNAAAEYQQWARRTAPARKTWAVGQNLSQKDREYGE